MSDSGSSDTNGRGAETRGLRQFEKNRFFNGKLMTARDMRAEQDYHAGRLAALARHVTGEGIVCGLEVSIEQAEGGSDTPTAVVEPGLAFDSGGRPIVVAGDPAREEIPSERLGDGVSVFIEQSTCKTESVPAVGSEDACKEECDYNRLRETVEVTFTPGPPATQQKPVPVDRVSFPSREDLRSDGTEGDEIDPDDDALQGLALSYHRDSEEGRYRSCDDLPRDTAGEARVFLGYLRQRGDGSWHPVDGAGVNEPRPHVYTNDMLYAGLTKHALDFENPHEVSLTADPLERAGGGTGNLLSGADATLTSGEVFDQGQRLELDLSEVLASGYVEEMGGPEEITFRLRRIEDGEVSELVTELAVNANGLSVLDTTNLEGTYAVYLSVSGGGEELLRFDQEGVGSIDFEEVIEEGQFEVAVRPESEGAKLRVTDHRGDDGTVDIASSDGSVAITTSSGDGTTPSEIDLTVAGGGGVEELEPYLREHALRRTACVFADLRDQFEQSSTEVASTADDLAEDAREELGADAPAHEDPDEFVDYVEENLQRPMSALVDQLPGFVGGGDDYERGVGRLNTAVGNRDPLEVAIALHRICEAADCLSGHCIRFDGFNATTPSDTEVRPRGTPVTSPLTLGEVVIDPKLDPIPGNWDAVPAFVPTEDERVALGFPRGGLRIVVPTASFAAVTVREADEGARLGAFDDRNNRIEEDEGDTATQPSVTLSVEGDRINHLELTCETQEARLVQVCLR